MTLFCFFISFPSLPIFGFLHTIEDSAGNRIQISQSSLSSFLSDDFYPFWLKGASVLYYILLLALLVCFLIELLPLISDKRWIHLISCILAAINIVFASMSFSGAFPIWLILDLLLFSICVICLTTFLFERKGFTR